jgi:hypothetical protein
MKSYALLIVICCISGCATASSLHNMSRIGLLVTAPLDWPVDDSGDPAVLAMGTPDGAVGIAVQRLPAAITTKYFDERAIADVSQETLTEFFGMAGKGLTKKGKNAQGHWIRVTVFYPNERLQGYVIFTQILGEIPPTMERDYANIMRSLKSEPHKPTKAR